MAKADTNQLLARVKELDSLPRHIAFIMDGNGRWAKKRNLPRALGHKEGVNSVREMVEAGGELGIDVMTFYTFSVENWKRPAREVSALMKLLVSTLRREVDDLDKNNVQLRVIGRLTDLPESTRHDFDVAVDRLKKNTGLVLNLALSYGSRQEMVEAVNKLLQEKKEQITEEDFANALYTTGLPDPDLLIRTSGEFRLSNFYLWQCAYTELYITNVFWPDFRKPNLYQAILDYTHRERRFGCTSEQLGET